jgi:hypothetical protein
MKAAEFAATLAGALGAGGNFRAGARPVDESKVRLRTVEFTADQLILKKVIDARLPDVFADAETGIALLSYCLSELILRTARPGMLPEAVATAVQVLQFNCGVAQPAFKTRAEICEEHGITLPKLETLTDHEAGCAINGPIYGSTPHCDCAFGRQFK